MSTATYDPESAEARACQSHPLGVHTICPSPTNPRKTFPEAEQTEMVESVRRHGVLQPILVRLWPAEYDKPAGWADMPLYELIAGERRFRAASAAGLALVPGMVKHLTTREVLEIQVIENLCRKDLHPLEEAEGYELMMKSHDYSADELAEKIGKSRAYIYGRLKLTALCAEAREAFRADLLSPSTALLVARIPGAELQRKALADITDRYDGPMSYRRAVEHVQRNYMLKMEGAPFPIWLDSLVTKAGSCNDCPKRTANSRDLFSDIDADVCTDPACFTAKKDAQVERQKAAAEARGQKVITGKAAEKIAPYGANSSITGYAVLDSKNYDAGFRTEGGYPTNRELLGDRDVPITLIEDVRTGTLIEAVDSKAIAEALKEAGIKPTTPGRSAADLKREADVKFETAFRRRLFDETRTAIRVELNGSKNPALKVEDMRLVARQFWGRSGHYACAPLAKLYVSSEEKLDDHARIHRVSALIDTFNAAQLIQFLFDLSLIGTLDVPNYSLTIETPAPLVKTAESVGLSPDDIRKSMKTDEKAKAAKKSAAKPSPTSTQAARAGEGGESKKQKADTATKAARAADKSRGKNEVQAAGAARKTKERAKDRGRSAAEGDEKTTAAEVPEVPTRCDKTLDLLAEVPTRCDKTLDLLAGVAA